MKRNQQKNCSIKFHEKRWALKHTTRGYCWNSVIIIIIIMFMTVPHCAHLYSKSEQTHMHYNINDPWRHCLVQQHLFCFTAGVAAQQTKESPASNFTGTRTLHHWIVTFVCSASKGMLKVKRASQWNIGFTIIIVHSLKNDKSWSTTCASQLNIGFTISVKHRLHYRNSS